MQHYIKFSDYDDANLNALPANITARLDVKEGWKLVSDADHGKVLVNTLSPNTRRCVTFDDVPAADEGEVYIEAVSADATEIFSIRAALNVDATKNTSGSNAHLYAAGYRKPTSTVISIQETKYLDGTPSVLQDFSVAATGVTDNTEIFCTRARVRRDSPTQKTISAKFWRKTDPEPATFSSIAVDDSSPVAAGLFGIFVFTGTASRYVAIGIGTGADVAPTAPVATATTKGIRETLYNGSTPLANLTGLTAVVIDQSPVTVGNPSCKSFSGSTNASGEIVIDIDSFTSQAVGGKCWLVVKQYNATTPQDTLVWSGEVDIKNIA